MRHVFYSFFLTGIAYAVYVRLGIISVITDTLIHNGLLKFVEQNYYWVILLFIAMAIIVIAGLQHDLTNSSKER